MRKLLGGIYGASIGGVLGIFTHPLGLNFFLFAPVGGLVGVIARACERRKVAILAGLALGTVGVTLTSFQIALIPRSFMSDLAKGGFLDWLNVMAAGLILGGLVAAAVTARGLEVVLWPLVVLALLAFVH